LKVGRGGVASGAVINGGGTELISGGQDVGATVNNGGQYAALFGSISDTAFNAGARGTVGANVSGMRVGNGATVALKNFFAVNMAVSGLVIDSGGTADVIHFVPAEIDLSGLAIGGRMTG
jgi:hypothetical protein